MELRQRADAIGREKFALIQHESAECCAADPGLTMESNRRSSMPSLRMQATLLVRSGRFSMNHSSRRLKSGKLVEHFRLQRLHRKQRNQPDHRTDLHREAGVPSGSCSTS